MNLKYLTCFRTDYNSYPVNIVFTESLNPGEMFYQIITIIKRLVYSEDVSITYGK